MTTGVKHFLDNLSESELRTFRNRVRWRHDSEKAIRMLGDEQDDELDAAQAVVEMQLADQGYLLADRNKSKKPRSWSQDYRTRVLCVLSEARRAMGQ